MNAHEVFTRYKQSLHQRIVDDWVEEFEQECARSVARPYVLTDEQAMALDEQAGLA